MTAVFRCPMCRTQNLKKFYRGRIQVEHDMKCFDCGRCPGPGRRRLRAESQAV